tara:strand:- start:1764 stop:1895 length:132 start_codon:yes stop_codon:yes gene_type:complete
VTIIFLKKKDIENIKIIVFCDNNIFKKKRYYSYNVYNKYGRRM